jgi:hypothetical protein
VRLKHTKSHKSVVTYFGDALIYPVAVQTEDTSERGHKLVRLSLARVMTTLALPDKYTYYRVLVSAI